jgi:hypothetical protein
MFILAWFLASVVSGDDYICSNYRAFTQPNESLSMYFVGADVFDVPVADFATARINCQSLTPGYSDLVVFPSQQFAASLVDRFANYFSTYGGFPWVGLVRNDTSSSTLTDGWTWVNGSVFDDANFWASGQPNNEAGQENCSIIDKSGRILDSNCDSQMRWYVCEIRGDF